MAARALGIGEGCFEGEPERGVRLVPVLVVLVLAELFTDAVLLTAVEETTLVALRATRLEVAVLLTFAFGRKVGDGAAGYLYGDGERET
jgi:hypothetical protein